jgi:hypothetical protein
MKTLEQEAEEYAVEMLSKMENRATARILEEYAKKDFIAGANSKWVQAQIIKAKIEGLLLANDNGSGIMYRIEELEEQLNELEEDENRR